MRGTIDMRDCMRESMKSTMRSHAGDPMRESMKDNVTSPSSKPRPHHPNSTYGKNIISELNDELSDTILSPTPNHKSNPKPNPNLYSNSYSNLNPTRSDTILSPTTPAKSIRSTNPNPKLETRVRSGSELLKPNPNPDRLGSESLASDLSRKYDSESVSFIKDLRRRKTEINDSNNDKVLNYSDRYNNNNNDNKQLKDNNHKQFSDKNNNKESDCSYDNDINKSKKNSEIEEEGLNTKEISTLAKSDRKDKSTFRTEFIGSEPSRPASFFNRPGSEFR
jgi:hypothetical protein